jgi:hypothetical protein
MVVIDVDDTLINYEREVTPATKQALEDAVKQGTLVTLATGRMFASAQKIARQINLNVPIITYQGSLIKNLLDEEILYERSVPADTATFLFRYAEEHGLHIQAYHNDILYSKTDNQRVKDYAEMSNIPYTVEPQLDRLLSLPLTKILFFDEPDVCDRVALELEPLIGAQVHITKSKPFFLEILHKEGTKGHAVQHLADHFHIGLDQVIAIGDSWNDHEMIEIAGLGVAMGNAIQPLKDIADFVTLSNNEDGVKHVIDKFILNNNS